MKVGFSISFSNYLVEDMTMTHARAMFDHIVDTFFHHILLIKDFEEIDKLKKESDFNIIESFLVNKFISTPPIDDKLKTLKSFKFVFDKSELDRLNSSLSIIKVPNSIYEDFSIKFEDIEL